jgi:hypothetical protein
VTSGDNPFGSSNDNSREGEGMEMTEPARGQDRPPQSPPMKPTELMVDSDIHSGLPEGSSGRGDGPFSGSSISGIGSPRRDLYDKYRSNPFVSPPEPEHRGDVTVLFDPEVGIALSLAPDNLPEELEMQALKPQRLPRDVVQGGGVSPSDSLDAGPASGVGPTPPDARSEPKKSELKNILANSKRSERSRPPNAPPTAWTTPSEVDF